MAFCLTLMPVHSLALTFLLPTQSLLAVMMGLAHGACAAMPPDYRR